MRKCIIVVLITKVLAFTCTSDACTAFYAAQGNIILAGNNEDFVNPQTKVWFVPTENGRFGRIYFGFGNFYPQGGMNERGLFFDGFATGPVKVARSLEKPKYPGNLCDKVMAECATVEEVLAIFDQHNLEFMERAMLMFGDATGNSVIIEGDEVISKKGKFQVVTNFYQSQTHPGQEPCERYQSAVDMLEHSQEISLPLFRRILAAVHVEGAGATLYSNIYDLRRGIVYVYHFHNFENPVIFNLAEELKKGKRAFDLPSLFPKTYAAEVFAREKLRELQEKRNARRAPDIDPRIYEEYAGQYEVLPGLIVTISKEKDRLYADVPGTAKVELIPESATSFFYIDFTSAATVTFDRNDEGKISGLDADVNGQKFSARKIR